MENTTGSSSDKKKSFQEVIDELQDTFLKAEKTSFKGCKKLYEATKNSAYGERVVPSLAKQLGWCEDEVRRRANVGKVFGQIHSDHVAGFAISHLKRLAILEELGLFILNNKWKFTCKELDQIASNKEAYSKLTSFEQFKEILLEESSRVASDDSSNDSSKNSSQKTPRSSPNPPLPPSRNTLTAVRDIKKHLSEKSKTLKEMVNIQIPDADLDDLHREVKELSTYLEDVIDSLNGIKKRLGIAEVKS